MFLGMPHSHIFPVLILMGNFAKIKIDERNKVTPLTPSHRTIVLFAAFFGSWFDLFEQLLSFSVSTNEGIHLLITNRTVYPLHSVTTMITAFGVGWIFLNRKNMPSIVKVWVFLVSLSLSSIFHSLWNRNFWIVENETVRMNNLAILGLAEHGKATGKNHIVSTQIEHKAVLEPLAVLARQGFEVELVLPNPGGWVPVDAILEAVRSDTLLVSVMHVNNETGVIQPVSEIADNLIDHPAYFHVDAAQGFGKSIKPLRNPRIDLQYPFGHERQCCRS